MYRISYGSLSFTYGYIKLLGSAVTSVHPTVNDVVSRQVLIIMLRGSNPSYPLTQTATLDHNLGP